MTEEPYPNSYQTLYQHSCCNRSLPVRTLGRQVNYMHLTMDFACIYLYAVWSLRISKTHNCWVILRQPPTKNLLSRHCSIADWLVIVPRLWSLKPNDLGVERRCWPPDTGLSSGEWDLGILPVLTSHLLYETVVLNLHTTQKGEWDECHNSNIMSMI